MPVFHRSSSPTSAAAPAAARRRAAPTCRGGASSMLRLAKPASPRQGALGQWLSRAASVLSPLPEHVVGVRHSEFAPSAWLVGH